METSAAIIHARSERQAMDWSLVLASQGIETVIDRGEEGRDWQLLVHTLDHQRALAAIHLYRAENRGQIWRRKLPGTGLVFDARCIPWFFLLVILFAMSPAQGGGLRTAGLMDSEAVRAGEWWRLFTAIMLHADIAHLAANVTTGILLLGLAMGTFGSGLGLLGAYLAGVGGNLAGLLLNPGIHRSLGASGMVTGALGLLAAQSLVMARIGTPARQLALRGLWAGVLLLVLFGFNPATDVLAHVAGFLTGVLLGGVLALLPARVIQLHWVNRLAEMFCAALVVWTWWLALR